MQAPVSRGGLANLAKLEEMERQEMAEREAKRQGEADAEAQLEKEKSFQRDAEDLSKPQRSAEAKRSGSDAQTDRLRDKDEGDRTGREEVVRACWQSQFRTFALSPCGTQGVGGESLCSSGSSVHRVFRFISNMSFITAHSS